MIQNPTAIIAACGLFASLSSSTVLRKRDDQPVPADQRPPPNYGHQNHRKITFFCQTDENAAPPRNEYQYLLADMTRKRDDCDNNRGLTDDCGDFVTGNAYECDTYDQWTRGQARFSLCNGHMGDNAAKYSYAQVVDSIASLSDDSKCPDTAGKPFVGGISGIGDGKWDYIMVDRADMVYKSVNVGDYAR